MDIAKTLDEAPTGRKATFLLRGGGSFEIEAHEIKLLIDRNGRDLLSVLITGSRDRIGYFAKGELAAVIFHDEEPDSGGLHPTQLL